MAFDVVKQNYSKAAEEGYTFDLILPDGSDAGAKLTILGDLSTTVQNFSKQKYKEFKTRVDQLKRKNKEFDISLEAAEEEAIESALVRLVGWEGITENGKEVKFSKEAAENILRIHPWIRDQIFEEAANVSNFIPK